MQKIIMISRDLKVLRKDSEVYSRMLEYSTLFSELHIVVMGTSKGDYKDTSLGNLSVYNETSKFAFVSFFKSFWKSFTLAGKLKSKDTWITSQDPFESGILAFFVAKFRGIRLQLQLHTDCFSYFYAKHGAKNYIRSIIARLLIPRCDSLRVVSKRIKRSITERKLMAEERIHVLPIFTDIQSEELKKDGINLKEKFPEFKKIILIVARLESEKNIPLSLFAFKKALRFDNSLGLVIAGSGSQEKWLHEYAKHLDIQAKIKFLGWQSDVVSLYRSADALLVTSLFEGYGLTMIESIASATPVIATDVGIAREAGANIVSYDAGGIALKIIEVLSQKKPVVLKEEFMISKQGYMDLFKKTFTTI